LKVEFGVPEEKSGLTRRLAAMPGDTPPIMIHYVAAIELSNSIVAQARPLTYGERAGFMANQTQRKIQTLAVPRVAVIRHSHGRLLLAAISLCLRSKKN
jgi:hypothetical protein